jgi:lipopolysaccharide heptosyltransferase II
LQKFLVIQTAFIGDVILGTAVIEKLHRFYPGAQLHFLVRKGNEGLLNDHPFLDKVIVWDKKQNKLQNLRRIAAQVRGERYDAVINLQRFASSGIIAGYSGAKQRIGFDKNPLSFLLTKKIKHEIGTGKHEVQRDLELVEAFTDSSFEKPKLYPSAADAESVKQYKQGEYICIAPTSVWFTKQYPEEKWIDLLKHLDQSLTIYLLGAPGDAAACDRIMNGSGHPRVQNLAGKLSFLQSAALMKDAKMNYVNDSAPMHMASAVNAPVTAIFCSTIPAFGFGPLSDVSRVVEKEEKLYCRPCGLHGYKACPQGHFRCAHDIRTEQLL